jgi:Zn-finger nucleic acid-binding protein
MDEREREGVTVDVCRVCRGVWLDRGELEKIIARAGPYDDEDEDDDDDDGDDDRPGRARPRDDAGRVAGAESPVRREPRKRSWLENLGDLFD